MRKIILLIVIVCSVFISTHKTDGQYNKKNLYNMAYRAMAKGDYRSSIELMSVLVEYDYKDFDALFIRAVAKYNMNDLYGAERDLTNAIKYNNGYAQAYQYRAIVRAMRGNYNAALNDFKMAIKQRPDFTEVFYSRGVTLFLNQQFDEAIADFTHCLKLNPDMMDAYINRGASYLLIKDTTAALNDYNSALKLDFRNSDIYVRRAMIYSQQKKYDLAYNDFNSAIMFDTLSANAYFSRAITNAQTNKYQDAVNDFSKVLAIDPRNSLTYFNRAILYYQIGDYNNALSDYDKVVEISPNNVLGVYNRGMLNAKLGNLINAHEDYTRAIELYPDFANAYMNRSNIKYLLQDMTGSKEDSDIAKEKIKTYRSKMDQISFETMVDTSQVMNKLLSFDMDFGNSEFSGVMGKKFDIKQLPQFRLSFTDSPQKTKLNRTYHAPSLSATLREYGNNMALIYKDFNVKNNTLLKQLSKPENRLYFNDEEAWKQHAFDAIIQASSKQYYNAINYYNRAINLNPNQPYLYANRAVAYSEMVDFVSTIDANSQKLVIGVDKTKELKNRKTKYSYNDAIKDINKSIDLEPNVAYLYYNRGVVRCLNGDMTGAIDDYTHALHLYPNFAEALYNRGMIQLYIKETEKGFLDISKSSDLNLPEAYEVLENFGSMSIK